MSPAGEFWDTLAGDGEGETSQATQKFFWQGNQLTIVGLGKPVMELQNTYNTGMVTLNGLKQTPRPCGKNGDPAR